MQGLLEINVESTILGAHKLDPALPVFGLLQHEGAEAAYAAGKIPKIGPNDIVVIGRQADTAVAKQFPGHNVLDIPQKDWSPAVNDRWLQQAIDQKNTVYVGSPTAGNLKHADGSPTVFARELQQLTDAGYTRVGDNLIPPP